MSVAVTFVTVRSCLRAHARTPTTHKKVAEKSDVSENPVKTPAFRGFRENIGRNVSSTAPFFDAGNTWCRRLTRPLAPCVVLPPVQLELTR